MHAAPVTGRPTRAGVVFVHGLFSTPRVWNDFVRLLSSDDELAGQFRINLFTYDSAVINLHPFRKIPDLDTISEKLWTYITTVLEGLDHLAL